HRGPARNRYSPREREPRRRCGEAGAPSPLRFGAAESGASTGRRTRRLIGAPRAPPPPRCAIPPRAPAAWPRARASAARDRECAQPAPAGVPPPRPPQAPARACGLRGDATTDESRVGRGSGAAAAPPPAPARGCRLVRLVSVGCSDGLLAALKL